MDVPRDRAVAAAVAVGRAQGLPVDRPQVVRDLTNVLVHLEPAPVVARVPVTLARLRPPEWFAQVMRLARFLADADAPVAPPADDVDPGPHVHDGLLVELWAYVAHDPARFDAVAAGRGLRKLHESLAAYPEPLPRFDRLDEVRRLLDSLAASELATADDLGALREAHARLAAEPVPDGRPLHGDAHFRNILWSPRGPLWSDLENACSGPRRVRPRRALLARCRGNRRGARRLRGLRRRAARARHPVSGAVPGRLDDRGRRARPGLAGRPGGAAPPARLGPRLARLTRGPGGGPGPPRRRSAASV